MNEIVAVPFNNLYGKEIKKDPRKVIFTNASKEHIIVTVVDPSSGISAEAVIRKDTLPFFVTKPNAE